MKYNGQLWVPEHEGIHPYRPVSGWQVPELPNVGRNPVTPFYSLWRTRSGLLIETPLTETEYVKLGWKWAGEPKRPSWLPSNAKWVMSVGGASVDRHKRRTPAWMPPFGIKVPPLPSVDRMECAVTVESSTDGGLAVASSITFAHTCTAATGLFVGGAVDGNILFSSVTYNGDSMTELWDAMAPFSLGRSGGYLMVSPDLGSAFNVVVTVASSTTIAAGAVGLLGNETSSVGAAHRTVYTAALEGDPSVTTVDSVSGDLVIDTAYTFAGTIAVDASQTSRVEDDNVGGSGWSYGISTKSAAGASTVMSWTSGAISSVSGATALIAAAAGGEPDELQRKRRINYMKVA